MIELTRSEKIALNKLKKLPNDWIDGFDLPINGNKILELYNLGIVEKSYMPSGNYGYKVKEEWYNSV